MEYVKLGSNGPEVSRIAFGCWAIGGHGYGQVDDAESVEAIRKAWELGVNFFDTADVYGFGHSEEILARALGEQRKEAVIATKFGVGWDSNGRTFKDSSPKRAVEALEGSLRRLRMDCIPLYQIHWWDGVTPISDTLEALGKCREAGKVRHIGCANFPLELILKAQKTHRLESLQCEYSVGQRNLESAMSRCRNGLGMGVMVYGVLGRGLYTGKYDKGASFDASDTRSVSDESLALAGKLRDIGARCGMSASQAAIRWTLENPAVSSVIVGMKNQEQVIENVGAFDR